MGVTMATQEHRRKVAGTLCEVDTVVSSASGSRRGDALEAAVLRTACPQRKNVLVRAGKQYVARAKR